MIKRNLEIHLRRLAAKYPVITLTGPRQSGKTSICKKCFPNYVYINLENLDKRTRALEDPNAFLKNFKKGVILDEIQRTPNLPSYIQQIVDEEDRPGMFILTGSQQFEVTQILSQSLAGRTAILKLLPCTIDEIKRFKKYPDKLDEILYSGSYPRIFDKKLNPTEAYTFYVETYIERDLRSLINIKNLMSFERFLKICAAHVGQLINYSSLSNSCDVDQKTIKSWLSILEASYIIFRIKPHHNNFKKRLTKSSKLYFYDTGLASYLIDITSPKELKNHPLRGNLFENFVFAEMLKLRFNNIKNNNFYFFRDHVGNEIDLILDYTSRVIPVEIKSTATISNEHLKGLQFYLNLQPSLKERPHIIYGGEEEYIFKNVCVIPFCKIPSMKI